ncbi:MAG TPA: hypothetical protein VH640_20725 [Bryobacteraceae bacterium]
MSELEQARSVEAGRFQKALRELETQQELRLSRIEAEMARRGLQNSDARLHAIFEVHLDRLNQVIQHRISIRKDLVRNYPELGSPAELNHLQEIIQADVRSLRAECRRHSLVAPPEVFAEMHARAQAGIERLQQEMPSPVRMQPKLPALSLNISHGGAGRGDFRPAARTTSGSFPVGVVSRPEQASAAPALAPDALSRKVDEVIGDLEERNQQLANGLRRLATAIQQAKHLPDDRTIYLEQVQFLAEQAARVAVLRRVSVVKGIMVALRSELDEVPSVVVSLRAAFPLLASHFGIRDKSK